jgi:calcineurin-like phosphoesterase family protein
MAIEADKVFFSSDLHFGHSNILKYANRPFMNAEEQEIVDEFNRAKAKNPEEEDASSTKAFYDYGKLRISRETVQRHDEALIANWNAKVPQDAAVYFLGDFSFNKDNTRNIAARLNGKIFFIRGNHDHGIERCSDSFGWIRDYYELKVKDPDSPRGGTRKIILCHYAMRVWNGSHHSNYMLYGHSHGTLPDDPNALSFDVGVDCHNYTPLSYDDVKRIMRQKEYKSVDHHQ